MNRTEKCSICKEDKPSAEMNGYRECSACADSKEKAQRAESGIMSDFGPEAAEGVRKAIATFPPVFGLGAFRGDVFRISERNSFVSRGKVLLYLQRKTTPERYQQIYGRTHTSEEELWMDFTKDSPEEIRRNMVHLTAKTIVPSGATNREGMTFREWYAAAQHCRTTPLSETTARKAWKDGEDPTEYAGK